jgi:hypothetical protein
MHDFKSIVREKLGKWNAADREELIEELAGHLEDRYENLLSKGCTSSVALLGALEAVGDWKILRTRIASAKEGNMTERARHIMVPGLAALLIFVIGIALMNYIYAHLYPHGSSLSTHWAWLKYFAPGLGLLAAAGTVGAGCSLYAGGNRRERLWAAEFPAICIVGAYLVMFVVSFSSRLISEHTVSWDRLQTLLELFLFSISAVMGCLLGALPFLLTKIKSDRFRPQSASSNAI